MKWLSDNGFNVHIAGRTLWNESEEALRSGFECLFERENIAVDAFDASQLVLFPEMDKTLDLQLSLFDEICMNPVQLSTLIAMVGSRDGAEMPTLPNSIFELYQGAVVATLRTALEDLAPESVALARETLQLVAVANQRADGRRVFTGEDVDLALDSDQHREIWWNWVEHGSGQDAIPLVRILTTATDRAGFEFQFTHISLQEFFFASELASATDSSFWGERGASASFQLNKFLNQNLFRIGGATLGRTLAANAIFDQPVLLTTVSPELLAHHMHVSFMLSLWQQGYTQVLALPGSEALARVAERMQSFYEDSAEFQRHSHLFTVAAAVDLHFLAAADAFVALGSAVGSERPPS